MDKSINFLSIITLYATFLGFILICYLFFVKSDKNKANTYLGLLISTMILYLLPVFVYLVGLLEMFPHVLKIYLGFGFLWGPFVYFYVRACTQKEFKFTPRLWLHLIPFLLNFIYYLPFLLLSGSEKIELMYELFRTGNTGEPPILTIIKGIYSLVYFIISARLVYRYKDHLNNSSSFIDAGFHRWLLTFCSVLLIPLLTFFIYYFIRADVFEIKSSLLIVYLGIFIFYLVVLTAILFKPEIFHTFPHQMLLPDSTEEKTQKYESSNLQEEQKEKFVQKLLAHVEKNKPFHSPELTIAELAEQVEIPAHYLSQVINEKLECSFLDFINGYRVDDAKAKLVDDSFSHYTIIAIAYEVGFNSKSAFYSAFKKYTGTTPSSYRKERKAS